MKYTSYEDLSDCIRRNAWKIPQDIDLIVGIPRSGLLAALMLSELIGKRCIDIDTFIGGREMSWGDRQKLRRTEATSKVLILDDTVYSGRSMTAAREKLKHLKGKYDFVFGCIYTDGRHAKKHVDIFFEDMLLTGEEKFLYEWNVFGQRVKYALYSMWDIDGLLCKNPPNDRNTEEYEAYLPNAIPMVVPTMRVGALVTYRLEKYRSVTEAWLKAYGIDYGELFMFPALDRLTRKKSASPAQYKAEIYGRAAWAKIFYESDEKQAVRIHEMCGKPVFCYENGQMYI